MDLITAFGSNKIIYQNEAWVDADLLLEILLRTLEIRKVPVLNQSFTRGLMTEILADKNTFIIFCVGAWTKSLLSNLEFEIPRHILNQQKLTFGSTFYGPDVFEHYNENFILHDKISYVPRHKLTICGSRRKQFISSTTAKISALNDTYFGNASVREKEFLEFASLKFDDAPFLKKDVTLKNKSGFRVGFGNHEFVVEKLNLISRQTTRCIVCAGAHKSGFIYAPMMGSHVEKLLVSM